MEDVVAWAYRQRDEQVPHAVIDRIRYHHPLGDAFKVGRLRGELLAMAAFLGVLQTDRNDATRTRVLATLMLGELPTNAALLEALLDAQIARYATQPHTTATRMACYLNALVRPIASTPQIWHAKLSSFDNQVMVDARLCVLGGGVEATLAFLQPSNETSEAYDFLRAMRDRGELDDLEVWREQELIQLRNEASDLLASHAST